MGEVIVPNSSSSTPLPFFLYFSAPIFLLLLIYPWILIILVSAFICGYLSLHLFDDLVKACYGNGGPPGSHDVTKSQEELEDPLLFSLRIDNESNKEGKQEDADKSHNKIPYQIRTEKDFKIQWKLDSSISRFTSVVFDNYVNSEWAPYETRKQLKLAFKQLLSSFCQGVNANLIQGQRSDHKGLEDFILTKVIPLLLFRLKNPLKKDNPQINFDQLEEIFRKQKLKVKRLAREVLNQNLSNEDKNCKIWFELCVSVLSDGVIFNLFKIGKEQIPELIEKLLKMLQDYLKTSNSTTTTINTTHSHGHGGGFDEIDSPSTCLVKEEKNSQVPFLLSKFLDPINDLEQPDIISSRWRPSLNEILGEKDLLYFLIQYLRKVHGLEFLQAVLDENDGYEYCRKVLELEFLPAFCRSKHFLESLGLSRVEIALDASNIVGDSPKRSLGHSRSSSLGGGQQQAGTIPIWKMEQSVVDGFAYSTSYMTLPLNSIGSSGNIEPDFVFQKRPQSIEIFILKFFNSTTNLYKKIQNPLDVSSEKVIKAKRVGTDSKSYHEYLNDPEINSQVIFDNKFNIDIFSSATDIAIDWCQSSWLGLILKGWINLLSPILKPKFEEELKNSIESILTVENFSLFIDLITEIFLEANNPDYIPKEIIFIKNDNKTTSSSSTSTTTEESFKDSLQRILIKWFFTSENNFIVKPEAFVNHLKRNRDDILLFLVDLLDLLVSECYH